MSRGQQVMEAGEVGGRLRGELMLQTVDQYRMHRNELYKEKVHKQQG